MRKHQTRSVSLAGGMLLIPILLTMILNGKEQIKPQDHTQAEKSIQITRGTQTERMALEDYLIGVTAAYAPKDCGEELLKAFMVMMRTGLLQHFEEADEEDVLNEEVLSTNHLDLSQMQERWKEDFASNYEIYQNAAQETEGNVLTCEGELITPYYHICSAGRTRSLSGYPYLKSVESKEDMDAEEFLKLITFSKEEIGEILKEGEEIRVSWGENPAEAIKTISTDGLYIDVVYLDLEEQKEPHSMSGERFAQLLGLPSEAFTIEPYKEKLRILSKGVGSGIGLSLYGAKQMEKGGKGWRDILLYYYSESEVTKRY